jgi:glycosyltransferase involved in cell wall biosynthesis
MGKRMGKKQKNVKILFLEVTSKMGGVEISTLNTASLIDKNVFEPVVCCPEEGDLSRYCREKNIKVEILNIPKYESVSIQLKNKAIINPIAILWDSILCFYSTIKITFFLKEKKYNIIITKGLWSHLYGGIAAKIVKIPCIWHFQEVVESKRFFGLFKKALEILAKQFATEIIGDAKTVTDQFKNIDYHKIHLIYNGVDTEKFKKNNSINKKLREKYNIENKDIVIGCVARLMYGKGQHILINSLNKIC